MRKYATYDAYYKDRILRVGAYFPSTYFYTFYDSVDLLVDVTTSRISEIRLRNNFSSKLMNKVGIGDSVLYLKQLGLKLTYDEEDIFVGDDSGIAMVTNEDLMPPNEDEIQNCIIESMVIKKIEK